MSVDFHHLSFPKWTHPPSLHPPVWSFSPLPYAVCCQCLPATYSASLASAEPLFATNKPSGRNEASQIYEHAENVLCLGGLLRPRSIKSMYISAPNGLRVNGLEEDKEKDGGVGRAMSMLVDSCWQTVVKNKRSCYSLLLARRRHKSRNHPWLSPNALAKCSIILAAIALLWHFMDHVCTSPASSSSSCRT